MARYAIGDIHGGAKTLHALLSRIGLRRREDRLYFLGDLIDRGSGTPDRKLLGGRVTVTGHKFHPLRHIEASLLTDRIFLDNGAFTGMLPDLGNLVALDLDSKKLVVQPWLDGE